MRSVLTLLFSALLLGASSQSTCDSLIIEVQYAAFNDTIIEVHVTNNSSNFFGYPGFILFDQNSDTLAQEDVHYFGIGQQQVHRLTIQPNANLPQGPFTGTVELWTGFYSNLFCSFSMDLDLCPSPPCSMIHPYVGNYGGAIVDATYLWDLLDSAQNSVGSGQLELISTGQQEDQDSLCVPPGMYTLVVTGPTQPTGGQIWFGARSSIMGSSVQEFYLQGSGPQSANFAFFPHCQNVIDGIIDHGPDDDLIVQQDGHQLTLFDARNASIGLVQLFDVGGKLLLEQRSNAPNMHINTQHIPSGVLLLNLPARSMQRKVVVH